MITNMVTGLVGLIAFTVLATVFIMTEGTNPVGIVLCIFAGIFSGTVGVVSMLAYEPKND